MRVLLRREFFARAGSVASRYGVTPERLIDHALPLRADTPLRAARMLAHLDDLTHATACLDGSDLAWADLLDMHELVLIHVASEHLDEADAIIHVRRWFAELRRSDRADGDGAEGPTLRDYTAQRPLRHWLAERVLGELCLAPRAAERVPLRLTDSEFGVGFSHSAGL